MNNWRPRYWIPVADPLRVIVAVVLAIIIILLLLRGGTTVIPTIVGPLAGAQLEAGQPIDLSGTAAPGAVVRILDGNFLVGETTADANGNWKLTLPAGLGAGTHELTARVFRGNAQVARSAPRSLNIAALPATPVPTALPPAPTLPPVPTAPPPIIDHPAPGVVLTAGNLGDVTGSAAPGSLVQILDGDKPIGQVTADSSGKWSWGLPVSLAPGAHALTVQVADTQGKTVSSSPLNITVESPPPTPVAPVINSPVAGAALAADKPGEVTGSAAPGSLVQILDGDKLLGQVTADSSGKWSFGLPSLSTGTHTLQSVVLDASGKEVARGPAVSVEIKPVEAPTISPIARGQLGIGSALKGKAKPGSVVDIFNGDKLLGKATAGADGEWAFTLPTSLQAGVYNLRAAILDSTGAVLSQSEVIRVQVVPPGLPVSGGTKPGP